MKFYWTMPSGLRRHYERELQAYASQMGGGQLQVAWRSLERAHILVQPWPREHTYVHWRMLQFGFYIKDTREIIGQLPRLLVGGVKSFVGKIPVGNTGGANVPPLRPLEIPDDLKALMQPYV